jgi:hypothetical protein
MRTHIIYFDKRILKAARSNDVDDAIRLYTTNAGVIAIQETIS